MNKWMEIPIDANWLAPWLLPKSTPSPIIYLVNYLWHQVCQRCVGAAWTGNGRLVLVSPSNVGKWFKGSIAGCCDWRISSLHINNHVHVHISTTLQFTLHEADDEQFKERQMCWYVQEVNVTTCTTHSNRKSGKLCPIGFFRSTSPGTRNEISNSDRKSVV